MATKGQATRSVMFSKFERIGVLAIIVALLGAVFVCPSYAWAGDGDVEGKLPRGALTLDGGQVEIARYGFASIEGSSGDIQQDVGFEGNSASNGQGDAQELWEIVRDVQAERNDCVSVAAEVQGGAYIGGCLEEPLNDASNDNVGQEEQASKDDEELSEELNPYLAVEDEELYWHEKNAVLAMVEAGISRDNFELLVNKAGGFDVSDVTDGDLAYGLVKLRIADNSTVTAAIERLNGTAGFSGAQPNYVYSRTDTSTASVVSDRYAKNQWALGSVDAYAAWDLVKTNGSVAVAVVDTGADLDHPDLVDNIVATYNSVSNSNTIEDQMGHGTHVAGIIAGVADNGIGVAGVSYNAKLVIIKASPFKSIDFDTASIVRAYAWLESLDQSGKTVAEHYNVRVVNLSIGGRDSKYAANMSDDVLHQAMLRARDEHGLLTVCAAGNGTPDSLPYATYPGDSEACICVINLSSSSDEADVNGVKIHDSSNYNMPDTQRKDLSAPGTKVYSTWLNGGYAQNTGTSMAAPIVSGIAALVFAANPNLTPMQVMAILEASAIDIGDPGWDEVYGYGEVNAAAAVRLAVLASVQGWDAVGVGGWANYSADVGRGIKQDAASSWAWSIIDGESYASIDSDGILTGAQKGDVTVNATCITETGAEVSATMLVHIVDANITGSSYVEVGETAAFATDDPRWTWVWKVENGSGSAMINQQGELVGLRQGSVYVTATCTSNTSIVLRAPVVITPKR